MTISSGDYGMLMRGVNGKMVMIPAETDSVSSDDNGCLIRAADGPNMFFGLSDTVAQDDGGFLLKAVDGNLLFATTGGVLSVLGPVYESQSYFIHTKGTRINGLCKLVEEASSSSSSSSNQNYVPYTDGVWYPTDNYDAAPVADGVWSMISFSANKARGSIENIREIDGDMIAVGRIGMIGITSISGPAKYNTTTESWEAYSSAAFDQWASPNYIYDIIEYGGDVYVIGAFANIDGDTSKAKMAKWDGSSWSSVGAINDTVQYITIWNSKICIAGRFTDIDGTGYAYMACYDGSSWSQVDSSGDTPDGSGAILSLLGDGTDLYVGGSFKTIGGASGFNRVAKHDGSSWNNMNEGLYKTVNPTTTLTRVYTLYKNGTDIIAGGWYFDRAGGHNSSSSSSSSSSSYFYTIPVVVGEGCARWDSTTDTWNSVFDFVDAGTTVMLTHLEQYDPNDSNIVLMSHAANTYGLTSNPSILNLLTGEMSSVNNDSAVTDPASTQNYKTPYLHFEGVKFFGAKGLAGDWEKLNSRYAMWSPAGGEFVALDLVTTNWQSISFMGIPFYWNDRIYGMVERAYNKQTSTTEYKLWMYYDGTEWHKMWKEEPHYVDVTVYTCTSSSSSSEVCTSSSSSSYFGGIKWTHNYQFPSDTNFGSIHEEGSELWLAGQAVAYPENITDIKDQIRDWSVVTFDGDQFTSKPIPDQIQNGSSVPWDSAGYFINRLIKYDDGSGNGEEIYMVSDDIIADNGGTYPDDDTAYKIAKINFTSGTWTYINRKKNLTPDETDGSDFGVNMMIVNRDKIYTESKYGASNTGLFAYQDAVFDWDETNATPLPFGSISQISYYGYVSENRFVKHPIYLNNQGELNSPNTGWTGYDALGDFTFSVPGESSEFTGGKMIRHEQDYVAYAVYSFKQPSGTSFRTEKGMMVYDEDTNTWSDWDRPSLGYYDFYVIDGPPLTGWHW